MNATHPIPRILHQTWRSKTLPQSFARFRGSWLVRHPAWEHRLYDDGDCRAEVASMGRRWAALYARLPTAIQRADLFRYLIVHRDGGVYADIDMECLRPIDELLEGAGCVIAVEAHLTERRRRLLGYREPCQFANCVFAAAPGDPLLRSVLSHIERVASVDVRADQDVEDSTGPRLLTRVVETLSRDARQRIRVIPQALLGPPALPRAIERWVAPYARHHFAGTWKHDARRSLWQRWIERDRFPPLKSAWRDIGVRHAVLFGPWVAAPLVRIHLRTRRAPLFRTRGRSRFREYQVPAQ